MPKNFWQAVKMFRIREKERLNQPPHTATFNCMMLELKLDLADSVAQEAKAKGLLEPPALERMLRDELKRNRVAQLFAAADWLAAQDLPALTEAEVEQEIQAARTQRRSGHANGR